MRFYIITYFLLFFLNSSSHGQNNLIGSWVIRTSQVGDSKEKVKTKDYLVFSNDGTVTIRETKITNRIEWFSSLKDSSLGVKKTKLEDSTTIVFGDYSIEGDSIHIKTPTFQRHYKFKVIGTQLILIRNAKGELLLNEDLIIIEEYKKSSP